MDDSEDRKREEDLVTEFGRKENTMVLGTEEICSTTKLDSGGKRVLGRNVSEYILEQAEFTLLWDIRTKH